MTGFADRFSDTQRAALAALGYTLLERRSTPVGAAVGRDPQPDTHLGPHGVARDATHDDATHDAAQGDTPAGLPHDPHRGTTHDPAPASGRTARPSRPTAAPATVPGRVVIEGMDRSALAASILHAVAAAADEGDPRVQQQGEQLAITLVDDGETWQLSLQQLRRSPRHKAALWRALRTLRRGVQ